MALSDIVVVLILLSGAAFLGFIAAWLIRQASIDALLKLVQKAEQGTTDHESLVQQYHTDRDLLKEEVKKYKDSYNEQLTKAQRLHENIRQNQAEIELAKLKVKELTEMNLQAQAEIDQLKLELLSRPKPIRRIIRVKSSVAPIKMGGLSLLDKKKL